MSYTAVQAIATLNRYLDIDDTKKEIIEHTKDRGFILSLSDDEKVVIFVYPLVHKKDDTKTYFDTRDSGAAERAITWNYAITHNLKYFCLGVNDVVTKYKDYIFSLECSEPVIEKISGTSNGLRNGPGNQIIIPNGYIPAQKIDRLVNKLGVYISVIHKDFLKDYLSIYDNRPYMLESSTVDVHEFTEYPPYKQSEDSVGEEQSLLCFATKFKSHFSHNRIIFGAPGTGKSWKLNKDKDELLSDGGQFERVTFHPDYTYSQFVGAYKPTTNESGDICYEFVPGPFMRTYVKALQSGRADTPEPYLLIIEEINRARVASVFGDIFQLLDRTEDGTSQYEIQASEDIKKYLSSKLGGKSSDYPILKLPNNMFIWASMNSADQGVYPMDTAFKRRWDFEYLGIDTNQENIKCTVNLVRNNPESHINWNRLRKAINAKLLDTCRVNEDKLLGPFFLSQKVIKSDKDGHIIDEEAFRKAFKSKVIMYLFEDAARQYRSRLFNPDICKMYSSICDEFDKHGMSIFGYDFKNAYYNQQKD